MKWLVRIAACLVCVLPGLALGQVSDYDTRLKQAEEFVNSSGRYLHQSRIQKGMKGYGLTVMSGTKIERFDVEVVSVMKNFQPHQDVILCNLSGLGLERTGVIEGMSGSPVYLTDPADGKEKLIGAVAYGWKLQKEPICGIQPIVQMLALEGVPLPASASQKASSQPASQAPASGGASGDQPALARVLDEDYARFYLDPRKLDFATMSMPKNFWNKQQNQQSFLRPLNTPLMISSSSARSFKRAESIFEGSGLTPMQSGSIGGATSQAVTDVKLEPGSSLSVPLVSGDADWSAVGTVTDVVGDYVLGFGHPFLSRGKIEMPMGPAYIHAVVPSLLASFKLGSTIRVDGMLSDDEATGVGGVLGKKVELLPLTLHVRENGGEVTYHYNLLRHPQLTPLLAATIVEESLAAKRQLPEHHWLTYHVTIDFGRLGQFTAANCSCDDEGLSMVSDIGRPLAAMFRTELGEPVMPKSIEVTVTIQAEKHTGEIIAVDLDKNVYRPGETMKGKVTLRPFRSEKIVKEFELNVPDDLADGTYNLTACEATEAMTSLRQEMPQRFNPKTVEQLFAALQEVVSYPKTSIYLRLPLRQGGLSVRKNELNNIPGSLGGILHESSPDDARAYRMSLVQQQPAGMVVEGSAEASFSVSKDPRQEVCQ